MRKAIALLVTVFFIMLISISVGVGLKYINNASKSIDKEQFLFQSFMILDDAQNILKSSQGLQQITTAVDMSTFLLASSVIPFENNGIQVIIKLASARAKINPNAFKEASALEAFKSFLMQKGIDPVYANYIFDSMSKKKDDQTYTSDIFNENPTLFRDYIASKKHLEAINTAYINAFHDVNLKSLDTNEFLYLSSDVNTSIDLNYATASTYELLLQCDPMRAEVLALHENVIENLEDLQLSEEEKVNLSNFKTSFFEPYLDVTIEITQQDKTSKIKFEYNIESKKGSHFVFEV